MGCNRIKFIEMKSLSGYTPKNFVACGKLLGYTPKNFVVCGKLSGYIPKKTLSLGCDKCLLPVPLYSSNSGEKLCDSWVWVRRYVALVVSVPIPLRTQRAGAPTRRKFFLRNYGKQKKWHRTFDTKQRKTLKKNLICAILNTVAQAANFDTIGGNYYVQIWSKIEYRRWIY